MTLCKVLSADQQLRALCSVLMSHTALKMHSLGEQVNELISMVKANSSISITKI